MNYETVTGLNEIGEGNKTSEGDEKDEEPFNIREGTSDAKYK